MLMRMVGDYNHIIVTCKNTHTQTHPQTPHPTHTQTHTHAHKHTHPPHTIWLVVLGFNATLIAKVKSWRSVTHMCFLAFSH